MEIKWIAIAFAVIMTATIVMNSLVDIEKEKTKQLEYQVELQN